MAKIDEKWDRIFKKIQLILEKNKKLEEANLALSKQNADLHLQLNQLINQQDNLKEQIQHIKTAKEVHLSEKERAQTKQQLKEFMVEIDDCLAKLIQ